MYNSLDEFEFWSGPTTDYGVSCPRRLKNRIKMFVATLAHSFFVGISFILAGYKDSHRILNEFEIHPDPTMDWGVSCP